MMRSWPTFVKFHWESNQQWVKSTDYQSMKLGAVYNGWLRDNCSADRIYVLVG